MAKSRTKEIAREKTPQERVKDSYSYEKACNAAKNSGTPTYHFAVGGRVQVGHLPNCVVEEVMDDGAMYLIRVTTKNNVEYSCWAWTSVRPLDDDKDTHFAKRDSALSRLHYSNRSMYSLLSFHYLFGVDFKPDYQRGSVWDEEDREKLLSTPTEAKSRTRLSSSPLPLPMVCAWMCAASRARMVLRGARLLFITRTKMLSHPSRTIRSTITGSARRQTPPTICTWVSPTNNS